MNWYEEWFDSPLYEKLYAYRDDEEAARLADLLEQELPVNRYPHVLDLGCGRGRHSLNMARRGYNVTGVDLSEHAIQKAGQRAKKEGLHIDFRIHDMRLPLNEQFDIILNLFTTFGYFDDDAQNIRVLKAMSRMLRPAGCLVIDYLNASGVRQTLIPFEKGTIDSLDYEIARKIDKSAGMVVKEMKFRRPDGVTREYEERVKLYDYHWFQEHLSRQGLALTRCFGDYSGALFNPKSSERLVIFAGHKS